MPQRVPVTYLFSRSCPSHEEGRRLLVDAADAAGVTLALRDVEITSDAEAAERAFPGSPTYLVHGRDVAAPDPLIPHRMDTCRAYTRAGGSTGPLPDRALLVDALVAARDRIEEAA